MGNRIFLTGVLDSGKTFLKRLLDRYNDKYVIYNRYQFDLDRSEEKDYIIYLTRPIRFDEQTDKCIFMLRDPRICWLLTIHKKQNILLNRDKLRVFSIDEYCDRFDKIFKHYQTYCIDSYCFSVKFEDILKDHKTVFTQFLDFVDLNYDHNDLDEFKPDKISDNFTMFDVDKIVRSFCNQTQGEFDYISRRMSETIKVLGYSSDLCVKTLIKDYNFS